MSMLYVCFHAAAVRENETSESDRRQSETTGRRSTNKSRRTLRQRKNRNRTASQDRSSPSEKSSATPNVTVLTPPPAISLPHTVSLHEEIRGRQSSDAAVFADPAAEVVAGEQKLQVPDIVVSFPADEMTDDKAESRDVASDSSRAVNFQRDNSEEGVEADSRPSGGRSVPVPTTDRRCSEQSDVCRRSTGDDHVVDLCTQPHADGSSVRGVARDADVDIPDSSFHVDTQMLCAVADSAAADNKATNVLQPAVATVDGDKLMSEGVLDASSELDDFGPNSATCQFMKEFSTQKCAAQTNAAVTGQSRDGESSHSCAVALPVETIRGPLEPQARVDVSVIITSEMAASSNFERSCVTGRSEMNRQIVYSEEILFDDCDERMLEGTGCLPVASNQHHQPSASMNNGITSDMAEQYAASDCVVNKSDLFASYIEEPHAAVRADVGTADLPATANSFAFAHDSITSTMLDRAMAAVNQAAVGNQLNKCPPSPGDASTNVVSDNQQENLQSDLLPARTSEPPDVDAETALHLLCDSSRASAKKPPKRRGRKRNSDSADPLLKSGTSDVVEKRRRTLSRSPDLPADGEKAELSLNQAVCFSVSFGSTSDSSAYVPPTPPSTATEKSNVNTPRRLLGGVAGITPVKPEQSVGHISQVKKNIAQSKDCGVREMAQCEASGIAGAAGGGSHEVKVGGSLPVPTQDLHSTQSFTIIDVAANRRLFDTFIAEWQQQTSFSVSLACEKCPKPQEQHSPRSSKGIGARFARGNRIDESTVSS